MGKIPRAMGSAVSRAASLTFVPSSKKTSFAGGHLDGGKIRIDCEPQRRSEETRVVVN